MNKILAFIALFSVSFAWTQEAIEPVKQKHFGVSVNTSLALAYGSLSFAPTVFFYADKHQFELGFGIYPFEGHELGKMGVEFNYKYFYNGIENRFSPYFMGRAGYVNSVYMNAFLANDTRHENHVTLTAGYGVQMKLIKGAYIGTNVSLGGATNNYYVNKSNSESQEFMPMFNDFYLEAVAQLTIGYRF